MSFPFLDFLASGLRFHLVAYPSKSVTYYPGFSFGSPDEHAYTPEAFRG